MKLLQEQYDVLLLLAFVGLGLLRCWPAWRKTAIGVAVEALFGCECECEE